MKGKLKKIEIQAKGTDADVFIYDDIGAGFFGGLSAKEFAEDIKNYGELKNITVRINSGGGDVFQGIAIYNTLVNHPAKIVVKVDGLAASIASLIAMAGDEVEMSDNAFMMVHEPWTITGGNSSDLRDQADLMDKIKDTMLDTYVNRSSIDLETITSMVDEETWLTADEALEAGLITSVTEGQRMAASVTDLSKFKNPPQELFLRAQEVEKTTEPDKDEIVLEPTDENIVTELKMGPFHSQENLTTFFK